MRQGRVGQPLPVSRFPLPDRSGWRDGAAMTHDIAQPGAASEGAVAPSAQDEARWLLAEQARLEGLIHALMGHGSSEENASGISAEPLSAGQHPADSGTETFMREVDLTLLADLRGELDQVLRVRRRLADGAPLVCEVCHRPIPAERLEAIPAARFCVLHEERFELGGLHLSDLAPSPPPAMSRGGAEKSIDGEFLEMGEDFPDPDISTEDVESSLEELTLITAERDQAEQLEDQLEEADPEGGLTGDFAAADLGSIVDRQLGLESEETEPEAEAEDGTETNAEDDELGQARPREGGEFVCAVCFQVKNRSLLADHAQQRCVDCVRVDGA